MNPTELADAAAQERGNLSQLFSELAVVIESLTNKELPAFSTAVENAFSLEDKADQLEDNSGPVDIKELFAEEACVIQLVRGAEQTLLKPLFALYRRFHRHIVRSADGIGKEGQTKLCVFRLMKITSM